MGVDTFVSAIHA